MFRTYVILSSEVIDLNDYTIYKLENIPCEILYFNEENGIYIDVIKTDEQFRGMGYARKVMESFISSLPTNVDVSLLCSGCLGSDVDRLVAFYESLGFEEINRNNFGVDMILEGDYE